MSTQPSKTLETFDNPHPGKDFVVRIETSEFTCVCPMTGQPDFANVVIEYVPDQRCVELKSLKLFFWSFREEGHFHEDVTNRNLNQLVEVLDPKQMEVCGTFNVRGGLQTTVTARHEKA